MAKEGKNIYLRGDRWYYRFEIDGRERRGVLAGATTEAEALALALAKREELIPTPGVSRKLTIDEIVADYFATYCPDNIKTSTAKRYEGSARPLLAYFSGRLADSIGKRDLGEFARTRIKGFTAAGARFDAVRSMTVRRDLAFLSGVYSYALNQDRVVRNPVAEYDASSLPNSTLRVRWLQDADFEKLVAAAGEIDGQLADAITFAGHTGLRWDEQFSMEWGWIDDSTNVLHIPGAVTKTGQPRTIPLDRAARAVIERRADVCRGLCRFVFCELDTDGQHVRFKHHRIARPFTRAVVRAGLSDFRWHDLRHHAASRWVRGGASLYPVSRLLGHSTIVQSEKYAHLSPEALRAVVGD